MNELVDYLQASGPAFAVRLGTSLAVVVAALVLGKIVARFLRRALDSAGARAFSTVLPGAVQAVIVGVGLVTALDQLGLNVSALLAGAGVVGLAIGFGSQTVVKDVVSGIFFVVDGALKPGDAVKIGDCVGEVEHIGLRMTEIRGDSGEMFYLSNGSIGMIANRSREWARISVDVPIPHDKDLASSITTLQGIADEFAADLDEVVLDRPEAQGVVTLDAERSTVRIVAKVRAAASAAAKMALLRRVRDGFFASP